MDYLFCLKIFYWYFGRQESINFKIGKLSIHDLEENTRQDTGTLSYKGYNTIFLMTQEMIVIKKKDSDNSEFKSDSEELDFEYKYIWGG